MLNTALIGALMAERNLTDEAMAEHLAISRVMFSYIRTNQREAKAIYVKKMAERLGVPMEELFRKESA